MRIPRWRLINSAMWKIRRRRGNKPRPDRFADVIKEIAWTGVIFSVSFLVFTLILVVMVVVERYLRIELDGNLLENNDFVFIIDNIVQ